MRKRAPHAKPEILGDILQKVLKKKNIPHTRINRRLVDLWMRAVGPQIAARTLPETIKRGTLRVQVSAPVWLHQLQFLKEEITKLNELSGSEEVQNLFFSIGEIPPPQTGTNDPIIPLPSATPLQKRDRAMMRDSLDTVQDPELREILERVMSREISRRREREKL
jgi:hypothetical protein